MQRIYIIILADNACRRKQIWLYSSKCCTRHDPNNLIDLLLDQEAKYFQT